MPDQNYATKQDLQDLKRELERELGERMDQMRDHLIEAMRDMQTEVLRAFHNWASPTEIKMRSHEERLTLVEERLRQIEGGRAKN